MTMEPEDVTFKFLQEITDDFSEERKLGEGAYGVVYKGVTKNGEDVAVKMLKDNIELDDKQFQKEFYNLTMLKHRHIVHLLGYCYETKQTPMEYNGRTVLAEKTFRALCFEYLHNGSLEKHLSDEFRGFDWHARYKIIKGICEGLKYIHEELAEPLYHLDLKPDNILLDKDFMPKIADFGLSRIFGKELTRTTRSHLGTPGYQPPEYIERGEISKKFDIFSLGAVMLKIISGREGCSKCAEMPSNEFIDLVDENWRNRLQATWSGSSLEAYCQQVKRCTEIALNCMENDYQKRPNIVDIINKLYEIETYIGKVLDGNLHWQGIKHPQKSCSKIFSGGTMHYKLIPDQNPHLYLMTSARCNELEFVDRRETSSDIGELIVGRIEEKNKVIALLKSNMEKVIILPIYGIGGIGKTTFAKLIYNDFKDYSRVWVYVSSRFDLKRISNSIISQLRGRESQTNEKLEIHESNNSIISQVSGRESQTNEREQIHESYSIISEFYGRESQTNQREEISQISGRESQTKERESSLTKKERDKIHECLRELFSGQKTMIVLDDLWEDNPFQLQDLIAMLSVGNGMNTIVLVTTRSKGIAEKICTNHKPYKLADLTDDMCWHIIKQRSHFEARYDKELLTGIGEDIARKCRGVALAAQSLGFMLQSRTSNQWIKVKDSDIWNNESISEDASLTNDVLPSLKLSYDSMTQSLKSCFTSCAIFPKGQKIAKHDLIYLWMSLGLVQPTKLLSTIQLCEKYIMQLLGLSFLQHSLSPTIAHFNERDATFTMHDLVHDMARSVMGHKVLDATKWKIMNMTKECKTFRYALLTDCINPWQLSRTSPAEIMVMRFLDCQRIQLSGVAFSSARSLRVLDLSECYIKMLPDSISQLKQLGYLNAPRINHRIIPNCITKLSKLIYLNLSGSSISALPESIGELECLMHLDISNCICIREVPASFGNLKKLVHLDLSYCKMLAVDPKALGGLTNIQYLNLSHPGRSLPIGGMLEIIGNLIELRYLGLSSAIRNAGSAEAFNFIHRICTLSNLEHLDLSRNNSITRLPESIGRLRKLHTLDLVGCIILERLPKCTVQMDSTVNLNAICFVTHADDGESSSNIGLLRHANPEYLHITGLENVKSMEEVKSIEVTKEKTTSFLTGKTRINYLKFEWTRDASRSVDAQEVLEGLVPPSTLHEFSIEGYNSVIFPYWVMDIKQYLPNLVKVSLVGLRKCNSLPPLGQLPNLVELFLAEMDSITTIGHSFCSGATAFPELKKLFLGRMENLQVWITIYSCGKYGKLGSVNEVMFPSLVKLSICDCPKLRMVPCPPRAKEWEIEGSDNVLSSCGDGGQTSASFAPALTDAIVTVKSSKMPLHQWRLLHYLPVITDLSIIRCTGLTYSSPELVHVLSFVRSLHLELSDKLQLPKWLGELKYLRELKISTDCTGLQAPPESLKDLIALRSLRLYDCEILTTTPKWLGQLISLQRLHIWNCTELNDLHGSMRHLWSLQELHLYRCENIVALPEWLGDLASLKELEIRSCRSIKSLPESIPKLAKLENLSIHYCPELAAWCKLEENKKKIAHIKHRRIS